MPNWLPMDPLSPTSSQENTDGCCSCGCSCCFSPSFRRSVKRKTGVPRHEHRPADVVLVDAEIEVAALRETVASQQTKIDELSAELEEERNAAATAASETMSMILRLQHEKAELQMEARQFRRIAEEKMSHDAGEIAALDDLLYKREQEIEVLSSEVDAYKHRILDLGLGLADDSDNFSPNSYAGDSIIDDFHLSPAAEYPPLRCEAAVSYDDGALYLEKNTSRTHEQPVYDLNSINTSPRTNPSPQHHPGSPQGSSLFVPQQPPANVDRSIREEYDDIDRVYTIDAIHGAETSALNNQRLKEESCPKVVFGGGDSEIKKLYMRLQVLEADRESMRQEVLSMRSEKANVALLGQIAQQLYKEVNPERRIVKKRPSFLAGFSFVSLIKWVLQFLFWRKNSSRSRYTFGLSNNNPRLLQILDKSPQLELWRCL
ncbi:hypothetical protein HPP92_012151 [Vanilla planifolia]|uniref:GTD-binding domain-containing protein n=1 Tax=Vanilla planifolia TaxID=51239 RepID=A0A835R7H9_VANPL|nr:hypothetical protein HPP92_012151 [Vanilla planifolia]